MTYKALLIGISAGGMRALEVLLPQFANDLPIPILIVQHRIRGDDDFLVQYLSQKSKIQVREASSGEEVKKGLAYISPGGYHLQVEQGGYLSLSLDPPVCHCIPSIDVLFESAVDVWSNQLIGVVLTGANHDGSEGLAKIKESGGYVIVQNPETAESSFMPKAALDRTRVDQVLDLEDIGPYLSKLIYD